MTAVDDFAKAIIGQDPNSLIKPLEEQMKKLIDIQTQILNLQKERFADMYRELREIKIRMQELNR